MRKEWGILLMVVLIASCGQHGEEKKVVDEPVKQALPLVGIDRSIDAGNSYSDLFLDSSAIGSFIKKQPMGDTVSNSLENFYRARNYEYAWFASDGLTEQALAFSSLYNYSKDSSTHAKWLDGRMDSLLGADHLDLSTPDAGVVRTELLMTWRFINYLTTRYADPRERLAAMNQLVPSRKRAPLEMAKAIADSGSYDGANPWYKSVAGQLKTLVAAAPTGGKGDTMTRIRKMVLNLERMAWMPPDPKGRMIIVNIPEFMLHVLEDGKPGMDMKIVVGKEGHSTVLFSGELDRIVFNPYWNVPPSIVAKEVVPGMDKHKDYLSAHHMEITGKEDGLPVVRQVPGEANELGKIKFLFPNSLNIYLHDTPHKDLFNEKVRAYSHGCIRVADAPKLAGYLLPGADIDSLLNGGKDHMVKLTQPVAVLICYFTVWPGENGALQVRKDIYGHDERLAKMLFTPAAVAKPSR